MVTYNLPSLPSGTTLSATSCTTSSPILPGGTCTLSITPGSIVSSDNLSALCSSGLVPQASTIQITANGSSIAATAKVLVLAYGCQYQGGYIFSIDDSTPSTESMSGKVFSPTEQSSSSRWTPFGGSSVVWGTDNASTSTTPSPGTSIFPGEFKPGQLNCNAVNDGACSSTNIQIAYQNKPASSYAAGLCQRALGNDNATICTGGTHCYTDWYLPSVCDLGPFGTGGSYPSPPGSQPCTLGSTNIQNQLVDTNILDLIVLSWSSTAALNATTRNTAWYQFFYSGGGFQDFDPKDTNYSTQCIRYLTN